MPRPGLSANLPGPKRLYRSWVPSLTGLELRPLLASPHFRAGLSHTAATRLGRRLYPHVRRKLMAIDIVTTPGRGWNRLWFITCPLLLF